MHEFILHIQIMMCVCVCERAREREGTFLWFMSAKAVDIVICDTYNIISTIEIDIKRPTECRYQPKANIVLIEILQEDIFQIQLATETSVMPLNNSDPDMRNQ